VIQALAPLRRVAAFVVVVAPLAGCGGETAPEESPKELAFPEAKAPRQSPPAHVVGGFSMAPPPVVLQPGEELTPCYIAPLELMGPSRVVGGGTLTVGAGMHHGNITARAKTGEGLRECPDGEGGAVQGEAADILEGGAVLFGSSTQIQGTEWQSLPDGLGYPVREGSEIVARMHYLNATSAPITIAPRYEWFTIDEAKVTHLLGPFVWRFHEFKIEPQSELTVTGGCRIPGPMRLVNVLPHMHQLGTAFTADFMGGPLDGQRFLDSRGYDPDQGVLRQFDPALDLSQGDGVRFSCTWRNTFDKPIVEGIGDNEMCMLFGYSYPADSAYSAVSTGESACAAIAAPPPPSP
jgi:hypothetical protein